ncbi:MAG: peptidylprolyl isomerase [Bacteroidetes bacterium]|nr:MAG: peptidylprolyl isomerase [Bacteroidota bacterium]
MKSLFAYALLPLLLTFMAVVPADSPAKKKDEVVVMSTPYGEMIIVLYDQTPKHKENFLKLVREGFYDGTRFHRVIKGFMVQGGDPESKEGGDASKIGQGGPGYTLEAEINPRYSHIKGALAAARQGDQVNPERRSSGSQFYLVENPDACRHLNGSYTVFGQVVKGLDVIDQIAAQPISGRTQSMPKEPIPITAKVKTMKVKDIAAMYGYELLYGGEE